jgi:hypothetical protein
MTDHFPIPELIENQRKRLGLRRGELARRCGFKNVAKGLRRIDGVCFGDLDSPGAKVVIDNLASALEVEKEVVEAAIHATAEIIAETERRAETERDKAWRASFAPHAYLVGSQDRPSQIFFYGLTGGAERWLKIPLDLSLPPVTYAAQAHRVVMRIPVLAFHGPTTGFIVNYTPDSAVRFDLDGNPVEHFDRAYMPGEVELFIGRRRVPTNAFATVIGIGSDRSEA